jgi:hypothetical protein
MANIPHGNSILVEGLAASFSGTPVISPGANPITGGNPAFSSFPAFNSTPSTPLFPASPMSAAGTSEAASKPGGGFSQYTLTNPPSPTNTRTPLGNVPPVLPPTITQALVNDPITLLQQTVQQQVADGFQFEGTVLNITTAQSIPFFSAPVISGQPNPPVTTVSIPQAGGGIENLLFLEGPGGTAPGNADSALVYATFWLEKLTHPEHPPVMQLQYAQMVLLNFPGLLVPGQPNFSWPHITVSTLRKSFG